MKKTDLVTEIFWGRGRWNNLLEHCRLLFLKEMGLFSKEGVCGRWGWFWPPPLRLSQMSLGVQDPMAEKARIWHFRFCPDLGKTSCMRK